MRSAFDFAPFRRSTVGFDRLFDMLENTTVGQAQENYPPFDLIKLGENDYRIELAVAGFKPDEIDITAQQNVLLVSGRKKDESDEKGSDYIYRGIANRSFERRFALADHIQVRGADLKDGLLSIELVREIPEAMKPRKIDIGGRRATERRRSQADRRGRGREPSDTIEEKAPELTDSGAFSFTPARSRGRPALNRYQVAGCGNLGFGGGLEQSLRDFLGRLAGMKRPPSALEAADRARRRASPTANHGRRSASISWCFISTVP